MPLLLQMEHISGLIKLFKVRAALGGTSCVRGSATAQLFVPYVGPPCPAVSRAAPAAFPNICVLRFQADVERKLSQMILDKKFHGETPRRCPGVPSCPSAPLRLPTEWGNWVSLPLH